MSFSSFLSFQSLQFWGAMPFVLRGQATAVHALPASVSPPIQNYVSCICSLRCVYTLLLHLASKRSPVWQLQQAVWQLQQACSFALSSSMFLQSLKASSGSQDLVYGSMKHRMEWHPNTQRSKGYYIPLRASKAFGNLASWNFNHIQIQSNPKYIFILKHSSVVSTHLKNMVD